MKTKHEKIVEVLREHSHKQYTNDYEFKYSGCPAYHFKKVAEEIAQLYSAGEVKVDPDKVIKIPPQMIKEGCDTPEPRKITLSLPTEEEAKIRYDLAVEHWHSLTKNKLKGKDESERQGEIVATFIECLKIAAGL
jgi:hypothetical protein